MTLNEKVLEEVLAEISEADIAAMVNGLLSYLPKKRRNQIISSVIHRHTATVMDGKDRDSFWSAAQKGMGFLQLGRDGTAL